MLQFLSTRTLGIVLTACVILLALTCPPLAFSQGCSLCYTQAASSGARFIQALRSGIVVLIFPPLSICTAAIILAYRRRNQFRESHRDPESDSEW